MPRLVVIGNKNDTMLRTLRVAPIRIRMSRTTNDTEIPSRDAFARSHFQSPTSRTALILGFFAGTGSSRQSGAQVLHRMSL